MPNLSLPSYYDGLLNSFPTAKNSNPEGGVTVYELMPNPKGSAAVSNQHIASMVKKEPVMYHTELVNRFSG